MNNEQNKVVFNDNKENETQTNNFKELNAEVLKQVSGGGEDTFYCNNCKKWVPRLHYCLDIVDM